MDEQTSSPKYATCSACGEQALCTRQSNYPDHGWVLPFDTFGYYGGFDDNMDVLFGRRISREWIFCHDCVVKLLSMFPRLANDIGKNCHSCPTGDEACCAHAWQGTDIFGLNEFGVHSRSAWPDGVWHDDEPMNPYDQRFND